ncbi:MAG: type-F conjugative transfer system secretin TraK [Rhodospirillales bacterium]|nr:type-F conjugative transfer system secretin TraK [Rhodospirillales bacterium]MDE0378133.1 type-F conjugative transfer system secretin TraK [Rhodospirillales bacterium]
MTHISRRRRIAVLVATHLMVMAALAAPAPAAAMQILDAADHAELAAEISATKVNRIALHGDRIARLVRAPDGFAVEHDAASGDLYLRPAGGGSVEGGPVTLFIGTEKGFTYRMTLTPAVRDSAQILIRNARALPDAATLAVAPGGDPHVAGLVRLVRAVARREALPGYEIRAGVGSPAPGLTLVETWRGPRFVALVFEAARPASEDADGAAGLAGTIEQTLDAGRVAALWRAAPATGPAGGRFVVAVVETAAGAPR